MQIQDQIQVVFATPLDTIVYILVILLDRCAIFLLDHIIIKWKSDVIHAPGRDLLDILLFDEAVIMLCFIHSAL